MIIASFDIGIKNLAWCVIKFNTETPNETSNENSKPYEIIEEAFDGEENVNLLDFIYFGPNQMNMTGSIAIEGNGILRENDHLPNLCK